MSYLNYFFVYFCLVSIVTLQGVPQNMTLARQLENRLRSLNLFVTFSRQPNFSSEILKLIITPVSGISKMWSPFFVLSIIPEI